MGFSDHIRDQSVSNWSQRLAYRAEPLPRRHVKVVNQVYLSTEKAVQNWDNSESA
jgi:hypothetical protein